jgi:hypothetical protein
MKSGGSGIHAELMRALLARYAEEWESGNKKLALLNCGMGWIWKRRGMMSYEHPAFFLKHEDVRGLNHGVVKAIGKRGGDVLGAGYPSDASFDAYPDGTESDADAARVGEKTSPAFAHFVPSKQKLPAGVDTFNFIVVGPDGFHLREVKRFECGIKPGVCGAKSVFGSLLLRRDLRRHVEGSKFDVKTYNKPEIQIFGDVSSITEHESSV